MVKNLVEMGFPEARSKRVLKHFVNNFESTMAHMLNNEDSRDNDILGPENAIVPVQAQPRVQMSSSSQSTNVEMLKMMLEMGYSREDATIALNVTGNKLDEACTFLINNPNPSENMPSLQASIGNQARYGHNGQQAQMDYAAQLAAQTSQRTQALYQDVTRLEQALQALV